MCLSFRALDAGAQRFRHALGWSLHETARRLGYASDKSIRQIEAGLVAPRPQHAAWIAEAAAYLREHPTPS